MGRALRVALVTVAMVVVALVPAAAAPPERVDVIVVLGEGRDARADAADMSRRYEAEVRHLYEHVFAGFSASVPEGRLGALARDPRVVRVDEDRPVHATAETAPTGMRRIGAPTAHGTETGVGLHVGILDTGIRDHGDLRVARLAGTNCTATSSTDDVHGHGTHVAGTVGAVGGNSRDVVGVVPDVTVVPIKVLDDGGSGSWSTVACGLDHASSTGIPVVNLSLSGGVSSSDTVKDCGDTTGDSLYLAVCGAIADGVTVVVAAGNDGHDARNNLPAAYPDVITVSALEDHNGTADTGGGCSGRGPWKTCEDVLASFSNYGPAVDVIAPGVAILSTTNDGKTGSKSGTSMAAPHVAGVAALIIGQHGAIGHHAVRDHLLATGQCPDTVPAPDGTCAGQSWPHDPDGVAEPLVHAAWAVSQAPSSGGGGGGDVANEAPTASFAAPACTDLSCSFTDTSTDEDGTVVRWAWDFGDQTTSSAQHPTHTYETGGTYTVTLVVTDDDGTTSSSASANVTVTEPSTGTHDWNLTPSGDKVKGEKTVSLWWLTYSNGNVDVYVDGLVADMTADDGQWSTSLGKGGGTHTFKVCEAGTTNCSESKSVSY